MRGCDIRAIRSGCSERETSQKKTPEHGRKLVQGPTPPLSQNHGRGCGKKAVKPTRQLRHCHANQGRVVARSRSEGDLDEQGNGLKSLKRQPLLRVARGGERKLNKNGLMPGTSAHNRDGEAAYGTSVKGKKKSQKGSRSTS